ncbi:hypothetical protein S83_055091, partial [Arachis hypogaea]
MVKFWHNSKVPLSVNVLRNIYNKTKTVGEVAHINPVDPSFSWNVVTLDGNNIIASNNKCSTTRLMFLKSSTERSLKNQRKAFYGGDPSQGGLPRHSK